MNCAILSWLWLYFSMYCWKVQPSGVAALTPHGFVHTEAPSTVFLAFAPPW